MTKRIAVLFHAHDQKHRSSGYIIDHLANYWREDGHDVVYLFGTKTHVPADLLIVHVNLSIVPEEYLAFATRYPIVLNGQLRDIRKSVISANLVGLHHSWTGPVIVKSDRNSGGQPERALTPDWLNKQRVWRAACRRASRLTGREAFNSWKRYRVFDSAKDVPRSIFGRSDVVVERFLPERENNLFHLRMCQVLGDRWTCTRVASPYPVIKAQNSISSEAVEPHAEVEMWRKQFKLDYGKLDYLIYDGHPVLIDINKTTGASPSTPDGSLHAMRRRLADGLYSYFA
jgi:hypothetical protein